MSAVSISDVLFVNSFLKNQPEYCNIFPIDLYASMFRWGEVANVKIDMIAPSIMSPVSVAMGRHVRLKIGAHTNKANLFFILNGKQGMGKTESVRQLCQKPLYALQHLKKQRFFITSLTSSSINIELKNNDNSILLANEEGNSIMLQMVASKGEGFVGFRSRLNDLFSGGSFVKPFATQPRVEVKDAYFSMLIPLQPDVTFTIMDQLTSVNDGLHPRFMTLSAGHTMLANPDAESAAVRAVKATIDDEEALKLPNKVTNLITTVYEIYREPKSDISLQLAPDAEEYLDTTCKSIWQQQEVAHSAVATAVMEKSEDFVYYDDGGKECELYSRVSMIFMAIRICYGKTKADVEQDVTRFTITLSDVKGAIAFVDAATSQSKMYKTYFDDKRSSGELAANMNLRGQTSIPSNQGVDQRNLQKKVVCMDGPVITTRMVVRKLRVRAIKVHDAFKDLNTLPDDPLYMGKMIKIDSSTVAFYKAHPDNVGSEALGTIGVTPANYELHYNASGQSSYCGTNWTDYYQKLKNKAPEGFPMP